MEWRIGCSGYHYHEWKGVFYPKDLPQRKWFEFYSQSFNTLELNVTFYRFPRVSFLDTWYHRSPEKFTFSLKAPRLITHFKRFHEAQRMLRDFYSTCREGLREKAGPVLFQFPPSFAYNVQQLDKILKLLDPAFMNVVEFRHISWWEESVFRKLREQNIAFCGMSHPLLPEGVIQTSSFLYYRFHGVPHLYSSLYSEKTLEDVLRQVQLLEAGEKAFFYFNNTAVGHAVQNARQMQEISEMVH